MYHYSFHSAGRGTGRGAMPFLMSFALEPEIVKLTWMDNASVQFPLNIYATKEEISRKGSPDFRNIIGLRFLARHLVTFNFPKRTMYLLRTSD
jgi:hypothetical protein